MHRTRDLFAEQIPSDGREGHELYGLLGEAYPGSKQYWCLTGDLLEDRDWLRLVVTETAERIAPPVRRKRRDQQR